jgi:hypothetical protein
LAYTDTTPGLLFCFLRLRLSIKKTFQYCAQLALALLLPLLLLLLPGGGAGAGAAGGGGGAAAAAAAAAAAGGHSHAAFFVLCLRAFRVTNYKLH